ncbi:MAG: Maf family nucleotide pyrophosphatase [Maribacter sp.]|nr:Maf family nucleotide pyrophosphatase [Maribacter sp.]
MLYEKLKDYTIILASGSPRRKQFLKEMGFDFEVRIKAIEEVYPDHLDRSEITDYLAALKASAFEGTLGQKDILITSDTVVWHKGKAIEKPRNEDDCFSMLRALSNSWHEVITSVCFTTVHHQKIVSATTKVKFSALTDTELWHYIKTYRPFDKAGGYGIQEWIGLIGVEEIKGSYSNVVGLPTHLVYKTIFTMVS